MENGFTRLLLVLATVVALTGAPFTAAIVLGQQKKPDTKPDRHPTFFKVYSKDARESLTASCTPTDLSPVVNQVTCKFIHVRFDLPDKRPDKTDIPRSVEEALKADPKLAEEVRNNPKKFEQELRKGLEKVKQDFCSPSSKERVAIETKMRDPEIGPK